MSETRKPPRILVIDDDPRVRMELQNILLANFQDEVIVACAEGSSSALASEAARLVDEFCPHVMIIDMSLVGSKDRGGLRLIKELGGRRSILYSAYFEPSNLLEAKRLGAEAWVSKEDHPQVLIDEVRKILSCVHSDFAGKQINGDGATMPLAEVPQRVLENAHGTIPFGAATDLLCEAFPHHKSIILSDIDEEVVSNDPSTFHRSAVFRAILDGHDARIVKFGHKENIEKEKENFNKYVMPLTTAFYAVVLDTLNMGSLGCGIYSYLPINAGQLTPFSTSYRKATSVDKLAAPLHHLFHEVWGDYYADAKWQAHGETLFDCYDRDYRLLRPTMASRISALRKNERLARLRDPVSWLNKHYKQAPRDYRLAVTHGDLHGDNLFVQENTAWLIDFERTGPGHIARDFIELEVDIVTRLCCPQPYPLRLAFKLAFLLAKPEHLPRRNEPDFLVYFGIEAQEDSDLLANEEVSKALDTVFRLRRLARNVARHLTIKEYYWALLLNAYFVAGIELKAPENCERAYILTATLTQRLSSWRQKWLFDNLLVN